MATSEAQKAAVYRYNTGNTTNVHFRFNNKTDADILAHLDRVSKMGMSKQGYVKELIRADMERFK